MKNLIYSFCCLIFIVFGTLFCLALAGVGVPFVRIDFASGSNVGKVVAVDGGFCGNYTVFLQDGSVSVSENRVSNEQKYCIDKSRIDLVEQVKQAMISESKVMLTYGKMVGLYPFCSCGDSPVEEITVLDNN